MTLRNTLLINSLSVSNPSILKPFFNFYDKQWLCLLRNIVIQIIRLNTSNIFFWTNILCLGIFVACITAPFHQSSAYIEHSCCSIYINIQFSLSSHTHIHGFIYTLTDLYFYTYIYIYTHSFVCPLFFC